MVAFPASWLSTVAPAAQTLTTGVFHVLGLSKYNLIVGLAAYAVVTPPIAGTMVTIIASARNKLSTRLPNVTTSPL